MKLTDHSDIKATTGRIDIPLNGRTYYARPSVPADVVVSAIGSTGDAGMSALIEAVKAVNDGTEATLDQDTQLQAAKAANTAVNRAIMFMQIALEPKSAAAWAKAMGSTGAEGITLAQVMAVYRDLINAYGSDGGKVDRPTTPSSSSASGRSGRGRTSTAGRRAKA